MTIICKHLAEATDKHKHECADKDKSLSTDLFRGPEFTGSEEDLLLLLKLKDAVEEEGGHHPKNEAE